MPRYDGTGPRGQGPMTGRGGGYCVVPMDQRNPMISRPYPARRPAAVPDRMAPWGQRYGRGMGYGRGRGRRGYGRRW